MEGVQFVPKRAAYLYTNGLQVLQFWEKTFIIALKFLDFLNLISTFA